MLRRFGVLAVALSIGALCGPGAEAALKKLRLRTISITESPGNSPNPLFNGRECCPMAPFAHVFLDDDTPGSTVLTSIILKGGGSVTVDLGGGGNQNIFLSTAFREGPGPIRKPNDFTGTGHTAAGSTILWGAITGWTTTGAIYCRANPPVVCNLADLDGSETTSDPLFHSDFYDFGTWTFHGTGFTATPFVHQYFTFPAGNFGNSQRWFRATYVIDATVPALPLLGMALIGGSLLAGGAAALRRRRR